MIKFKKVDFFTWEGDKNEVGVFRIHDEGSWYTPMVDGVPLTDERLSLEDSIDACNQYYIFRSNL